MKVLMTTDTVGGVLTYTAELAAALEASGEEVVVATMGAPLRERQRALLPERVHESEWRLEWMEDPWDDVAAAGQWLLEIAADEQPDVVHLCSYAHGSLPFAARKVVVAHSCVLSWWRAVHGVEAPALWDRYRHEMGAGLRGADAVVAPTRAMLAELERDHDLRPHPELHRLLHPAEVEVDAVREAVGIVIYNGSAAPDVPAEVEKQSLVLGSGRFWDPAKNLAALDAAARSLAWPVVVAGDLGDGNAPRHAESAGVLDQGDLARLRRRAGIYAAPALYEPFGLGILEAARDRCALVLGDIPSLREIWEGAAVFVHPRDERRLRWALEDLIEDELRREEISARAHRRAMRLTIARAARAYRELYARLVADRRGDFRSGGRSAFREEAPA